MAQRTHTIGTDTLGLKRAARSAWSGGVGLAIAALLSGCGAASSPFGSNVDNVKSGTALRAADFGNASVPAGANSTGIALQAPPENEMTVSGTRPRGVMADVSSTPGVTSVIGPVSATEGITDVNARAGGYNGTPGPAAAPTGGTNTTTNPTMSAGERPQQLIAVSDPVFVDAKIGDVNGRPVYAARFLESMGPRLNAKAVELFKAKPQAQARREWMEFAAREIDRELRTFIEDELLRAEALASFTPAQKQGFLAFMETLAAQRASESGGSRIKAEAALQESQGRTFDDWLREEEQRQLIRYQLSRKIASRVNVSWKDIQQGYERFADSFNRPSLARFRLVMIPAAKAEDVAALTQGLAEGRPFADLAASPLNTFARDRGGLQEREFRGEQSAASFFGNNLNDAARTLRPGEVAGPIDVGDNKAWLQLETLEDRTTTLYDAQLMLDNMLREQRSAFERARYIERLKTKATVTDTRDMGVRLLEIAIQRYADPAARAAAQR